MDEYNLDSFLTAETMNKVMDTNIENKIRTAEYDKHIRGTIGTVNNGVAELYLNNSSTPISNVKYNEGINLYYGDEVYVTAINGNMNNLVIDTKVNNINAIFGVNMSNFYLIEDCQDSDIWSYTGSVVLSDDNLYKKYGSQGVRMTIDSAASGEYIIYHDYSSSAIDLTQYADGTDATTENDYIGIALYISDLDMIDSAQGIDIEFYDSLAASHSTPVSKSELNDEWNYISILKDSFVGSGDWSDTVKTRIIFNINAGYSNDYSTLGLVCMYKTSASSLPQGLDTTDTPTFASVYLNDLTASKALVTDGTKKIISSSVTSTELGYLNGVTSEIQSQFGNFQTNLLNIDYGSKWTDLGQQASEVTIHALANLGYGMCLAGSSNNGKIFRSVDYGATWADLGQQGSESSIFALAYIGDGICLAGSGTTGKIFRSTDYGENWSDLGQLGTESYVYSLTYAGNGICLAGTSSGGKIYRSTNYGASWSDIGQLGSESSVFSLVYLGDGICLAGTYSSGKIYRSTNSGSTWSDIGQLNTETYIRSLVYLGNGICLAGTATNGKIFRSTDYGLTWTDLGQQGSNSSIRSLVYLGNGIVLAGSYNSGKIYKSTDYGLTWTDLGQQASETDIRSFAYLEDGVVLAGTASNGKILRSIFSKPEEGSLTFTNLTLSDLTASRVVVSNANKTLISSSITNTELGYLYGINQYLTTTTSVEFRDLTLTSILNNDVCQFQMSAYTGGSTSGNNRCEVNYYAKAIIAVNLIEHNIYNAGTKLGEYGMDTIGYYKSGEFYWNLSSTEVLRLTQTNVALFNSATRESSMVGGITIKQGTNPSTYSADQISIFATSGANSTLGLATEQTVVASTPTPDSYLTININGSLYKLALEAV